MDIGTQWNTILWDTPILLYRIQDTMDVGILGCNDIGYRGTRTLGYKGYTEETVHTGM